MIVIPQKRQSTKSTRPLVHMAMRCDPDELVTFSGKLPDNEIKMIRETGHQYVSYAEPSTRNNVLAHHHRRTRPSMFHWLQDIEKRNPGCQPPRARLKNSGLKTVAIDLED